MRRSITVLAACVLTLAAFAPGAVAQDEPTATPGLATAVRSLERSGWTIVPIDGLEGFRATRHVVHSEHDARDDLGNETERQNAAEGPHVIQVARRREVNELIMHQARQGQALVPPLGRR